MSDVLPPTPGDARDAVLVVEDDAGHRELLREELTEAGYPVTAVATAEGALALSGSVPSRSSSAISACPGRTDSRCWSGSGRWCLRRGSSC